MTATSSCQTCLWAVRVLEDALCDQDATNFIVNFVDHKVCPTLQPDMEEKCHNIAEGLVPVVVEWIRATSTPATLCGSVHACGDTLLSSPIHNRPLARPPPRLRDPLSCSMCRYVLDRVKGALNDTSTQDAIRDDLLQVCSELPSEMGTSCTDFINTYEPIVIQFIETADSETVCALVGACFSSLVDRTQGRMPPLTPGMVQALVAMQHAPGAAKRLRSSVPSNDACDMCKMAVIEAHSLVVNPQVQQDLVNYTKAVCDTMGTSVADTCRQYIDEYAPLVFDMLEKYLTPDTFCVELGICPPQQHSPLLPLQASLTSLAQRLRHAWAASSSCGGSSSSGSASEVQSELQRQNAMLRAKYASAPATEWLQGLVEEVDAAKGEAAAAGEGGGSGARP